MWYRARPIGTAKLLKRLPTKDALVVYIDFAALRQAGVLRPFDNAKIEEDPDYQAFAKKIDFDWKQDLDSLLVAATPAGNYMFARGRFDWKSLRTYAVSVGGDCYNAFCRTTGTAPDRKISFFPVQSGLMALAVSPDGYAASELQKTGSGTDPEVPGAAVWMSVPSAMLKSANLPTGTKMFARAMENAENVLFTLGPDGDRISVKVDARFRDEHDALDAAGQLAAATLTIKQMLEREHQKPPLTELAGILSAGVFRSEGRHVLGSWPMDRGFVENVLSGGVN
jgi:hypothetical protein